MGESSSALHLVPFTGTATDDAGNVYEIAGNGYVARGGEHAAININFAAPTPCCYRRIVVELGPYEPYKPADGGAS